MKRSPKSEAATGQRGEGTRRRVAVSLLIGGFLFAFALSSNAHEPITTKVRFNKEVIRILQRSCLGCHRPGGIAFSLATYDEARPWAKAIKEEVLEKRMPPWNAVKGYGEFRNAPSFTQRDIDLLVNWVEGGAPKGDDKDLPEGPLFSDDWQLGKPDLVLKPETEFNIAPDGDEYRTLALAPNLKEDRWLTAIDMKPSNAAVIHCATIFLGWNGVHTKEGAVLDLVPRVLATWMPGQKTVTFGDGAAEFLPAGSNFGVKVHYRSSVESAKDFGAVGLYFAQTPPRKRVKELAFSNPDVVIPVAAEPQPMKASLVVRSNAEAIAIRPRVHPLIISLQATAYRPNGSQEVLIWTRGYQFDWEPTYYFKRPVALPADSRIEVIAYLDNSDNNQNNPNNPAKAVRWSELAFGDPLCAIVISSNLAATDAGNTR